MATTSITFGSVNDQLVALTKALPIFAGPPVIQVEDAHPGRRIETEGVIFGGTDDGDDEWAALGAKSEDEQYSIALDIWVMKPGLTSKEARDRVIAFYSAIEAMVRADPTLGLDLSGAGVKALRCQTTWRRFPEVPHPDGEGRVAALEGSVRVKARI